MPLAYTAGCVPKSRTPSATSSHGPVSERTPLVFDYLDYRAFLRDYYVTKKATRAFSFRAFSKRAGLGSPNYLKLVIDGKRNLTPEMAVRFAKAAALDIEAARYFSELVLFDQAKTTVERNHVYARITGFRRCREARPLEVAHAAYHSTWYLPAIRELASRADFQDNPHWIADTLCPSIAPADAAHALETLLKLGLLKRTEDGRIVQAEAVVSTGPEARDVNVANFHRMMMQRASDAIDSVPPSERDISSLTLCLGPDGLRRLKARIRSFRRELLELSTLEGNPEQVVQVNFQLFPLSRKAPQ
jgi:uncharacterized protein (TIGR02147 family)